MTELEREIGLKLRFIRKKHNHSQEKLADYIEVTPQTISRYENGTRNINIETLWKIAELYQIPISYFFPKEETNKFDEQVKMLETDDIKIEIVKNKPLTAESFVAINSILLEELKNHK